MFDVMKSRRLLNTVGMSRVLMSIVIVDAEETEDEIVFTVSDIKLKKFDPASAGTIILEAIKSTGDSIDGFLQYIREYDDFDLDIGQKTKYVVRKKQD